MSNRRKWKESLKLGCSSSDVTMPAEPDNKKPKISVISQKTYKTVKGKLVRIRTKKTSKSNIPIVDANTDSLQTQPVENENQQENLGISSQEQSVIEENERMVESEALQERPILKENNNIIMTDSDSLQEKIVIYKLSRSPTQLSQTHSIKNITPTFRKPDNFMAETKKVLDKICPPVQLNNYVSRIIQNQTESLSIGDDINKAENTTLNSTDTNESIKKISLIDTSFVEILDSDSDFSKYLSMTKRPTHISESDSSFIEVTPENNKSLISKSKRQLEFGTENILIGDNVFRKEIDLIEPIEGNHPLLNDKNYLKSEATPGDPVLKTRIEDLEPYLIFGSKKDDKDIQECSKKITVEVVIEKVKDDAEENNYYRVDKTSPSNQDKIVVEHIIDDEIELLPEDNDNKNLSEISSDLNDDVGSKKTSVKIEIQKKEIQKDNSFSIESKSESYAAEVKTGTKRKSKRKIAFNKSYFDFFEEDDLDQILLDEAFPSEDSGSEYSSEISSESEANETNRGSKKKRKKERKTQHKSNKLKVKKCTNVIEPKSIEKKKSKCQQQKENKTNKEQGKSYMNKKGEVVEEKFMKPNPCNGVKCGNDCGSISEERRLDLFKFYWNLKTSQRRKDWISQCAIKKNVKRPTKINIRSCSYDYFINEGEGRRKVCQKFLLATLDVSQRFVLYTLETMRDGFAKADERGKTGGYNKTHEEVINQANKFITSLPLVPSHYCRSDSTRLYLPQEFKCISNLYRIYVDHCKSNNEKSMSFKVFNTWFKKTFNIAFHIPKKDKCLICSANTAESETEKSKEEIERVAQHKAEKEESYKRFKCHQTLYNKDKTKLCASFDMQKVLNTPHGTDMRLYYSRKLSVYNFTIYESGTRDAYCYVWNETDAHRGANEISTCLLDFIKNVDSRGTVTTLLLYADSCYGQNKNKTVLSMLRFALAQCENLNIIQINYLIPGHTYMPVDSIHATIENTIKKSTIWAPSQWPTIFQIARHNPSPYKVMVLKGQDFMGFDDIVKHTFKKNQRLAISKLKIATFNKQKPNVITVKYCMLQDSATEIISLSTLTKNVVPKYKLYPTSLPVTINKYNDLKKLVDKKVIPHIYANEYLKLKANKKLKDQLEDTDEEDDCLDECED